MQHRGHPDPRTFVGKGKLGELKAAYSGAAAEVLVADDELSPTQQRSLEDELGARVVDRTQLILDIFAQHARSSEGKLQVELAQLEYNLPRMRGMWKHLERLGGGVGTRGPGESQLETDRRLARTRVSLLKRRLRTLQGQRSTRRKERLRAATPTVALAGYTNVGKSTLLNALTGADASVDDRLFETLDPTTRAFEHDGKRYLVTDTVGFIRRLPTQLVEGFAATLEETLVSDLILHVADASLTEERLAETIRCGRQGAQRHRGRRRSRRARPEQGRRARPTGPTPDRAHVSASTPDLRSDRRGSRCAEGASRRAVLGSLRGRATSRAVLGRERVDGALRPRSADCGAAGYRGGRSGEGAAPTGGGCPVRALPRRRGRARSRGVRAVIDVAIRRLRPDARVPDQAYEGDAGLDLSACDHVVLPPGKRAVVPTGLAVEIPDGYAGFVQPRSGLAARHGIGIVNSPGLIDSGYRGEIRIVLLEHRRRGLLRRARDARGAARRRPRRRSSPRRGRRAHRQRARHPGVRLILDVTR